jgi:hypothetical protein
MDILRASVDDPDPRQGRRLVARPPVPRTPSELRVAAELRTADDELMVAGVTGQMLSGSVLVLNVEYISAVGWRRGHLWEEVMSPQRTLVAVVIAACVADCAGQRAQIANYAQNKMIGLTKEQVLACMGTPASKATEGATEVWSYPSESRFCTVNVTMMDGRVKRMNYVGPTGGLLSENEQCFFAVANCTY